MGAESLRGHRQAAHGDRCCTSTETQTKRDELHFTRERNGAGDKLRVSGDLDIASAPDLERAVARVVDGQGGHFHLDISDLAFTDVSGGQALLHGHNAIEARGGRAVFERPQQEVLNVLRLLGLVQVLDIRP